MSNKLCDQKVYRGQIYVDGLFGYDRIPIDHFYTHNLRSGKRIGIDACGHRFIVLNGKSYEWVDTLKEALHRLADLVDR